MPRKRLYYTTPRGSAWHHRSDRCIPPVRPVCMGSPRIHRSDRSLRPIRPVQQNPRGCNSALKCATRQLSKLGVSIYDFPPLCIPADKFDAAGAKIHVCVPWNKSMVATNPEQLILSKTYPTSGYNLAHISRHAKLLAGGYFAEKHCKWVLIS